MVSIAVVGHMGAAALATHAYAQQVIMVVLLFGLSAFRQVSVPIASYVVATEALLPLAESVLCVSGRLSFELVQKAVVSGIGALVTVSAPTALALDLAQASGLYLAALARDEPVVFNP